MTNKHIAICPGCSSLLIQANTGFRIETYCEECGWPDECRPPPREQQLWHDGFGCGASCSLDPPVAPTYVLDIRGRPRVAVDHFLRQMGGVSDGGRERQPRLRLEDAI